MVARRRRWVSNEESARSGSRSARPASTRPTGNSDGAGWAATGVNSFQSKVAVGATTYNVDSSHVPMLSQPECVLNVIRDAVRGVQAANSPQVATPGDCLSGSDVKAPNAGRPACGQAKNDQALVT